VNNKNDAYRHDDEESGGDSVDRQARCVVDHFYCPRAGHDSSNVESRETVMETFWMIIGDIPLELIVVVVLWYSIGVASICTTKVLADRGIPPLVLTFQQLFMGSTLLHLYLKSTGNLQPFPKPKKRVVAVHRDHPDDTGDDDTNNRSEDPLYLNFGFMGLFDGLDFFFTSVGFTMANASFVETVKSSQPITTTAVALLLGIDTFKKAEAMSMVVIVAGVFCATLGNSQDDDTTSPSSMTMRQSIETAVFGITANLCFALRVTSQKRIRAHPLGRELDDSNMLMWTQRIGSLALFIPVVIWELPGVIQRTRETLFWEELLPFWGLVLFNAISFTMYTLANTFVLSKVSVGQHTGLNALRRMFAILFTAVVFGVPITPMKLLGIVLCFSGFSSFSFYRHKNRDGMTEDLTQEEDSMKRPLLVEPTSVGSSFCESALSLLNRNVHEHGT